MVASRSLCSARSPQGNSSAWSLASIRDAGTSSRLANLRDSADILGTHCPSTEFRSDYPLTGRQRDLLAWRRSRRGRQSSARRQDLGVARFAGRHCFPRTGWSSHRPSRPSSDLALGLTRCTTPWRHLGNERGGRNGGTGVLRPEGSGAESTTSVRGPGGGPPEHDSLRPVIHR
jgi:hypothetical protein